MRTLRLIAIALGIGILIGAVTTIFVQRERGRRGAPIRFPLEKVQSMHIIHPERTTASTVQTVPSWSRDLRR